MWHKGKGTFLFRNFFFNFFFKFFFETNLYLCGIVHSTPYFMLHEEIKRVLELAHAGRSSEQVGQLLGTSHQWVRLLRRRLPKSIDLIDRLLNAHGFRLAVVKIEPESPGE